MPVSTGKPNAHMVSWARKVGQSPMQETLGLISNTSVISFGLGLPDPTLFPIGDLEMAFQSAAADQRSFQYGLSPSGLKRSIVSLMDLRGVKCSEEQIFLVSGAQQGIHLLTKLFLPFNGKVLTEELVYPGFQQVIKPCSPDIVTVPVDYRTGMDVEKVEVALGKGLRPSMIYCVPDGHNPLGISMVEEKRRYLAELADKYKVPIVEDDPYGLLSYTNQPLPPVKAHQSEWVFYVGSFSKILAPSLRVGWVVVPEEMIPKLAYVKESSDIDTASLGQHMVHAWLMSGAVKSHLQELRSVYRKRRDAMCRALETYFQGRAKWIKPDHGMFIWVELESENMDTATLLPEAVEKYGVSYLPGKAFDIVGKQRGSNCFRLNFTNQTTQSIYNGIEKLGALMG